MNRTGDIDGILEGWFLEGPMQMPDRLFDAVLDQVERVPQRRLARLQLRFTDMTPTARLLVAAGATILVLSIGVAAVGALQSRSSTAPSAPTPSASQSAPTTGAVPEALQHRWLGAVRSEPPAPPIQGVSALDITAEAFSHSDTFLPSSAAGTAADEITLVTETGRDGCKSGDEGTYRWATTPGGSKVTFTLVDDACAARAAVVPGEWLRSNCPLADDDCLGTLEAGRYSSQFVDPFLVNAPGWTPRFGAIEYTVPDGWMNAADWPAFYDLKRTNDPQGTGITLAVDVVALSSEDQCNTAADPAVGRSAEELANWLTTLPGVVATEPEAVTIGGLSGYRVDVSMDPSWTATCPFSEGQPTLGLWTDSAGTDFHWSLGPDTRQRNYLLDSADGRALLIDIEAHSDAAFDDLVDEATAVVESMVFTR